MTAAADGKCTSQCLLREKHRSRERFGFIAATLMFVAALFVCLFVFHVWTVLVLLLLMV